MALLNAENLFILLSPAEGWESDTESFVTALYLLLYAFYSIYSHHNRGKKKKILKKFTISTDLRFDPAVHIPPGYL